MGVLPRTIRADLRNDVLFQLIGTTYGGDGQNTFALPDLRGRVPVHMGGALTLGQSGGTQNVTLTTQQIPPPLPPVAGLNRPCHLEFPHQ